MRPQLVARAYELTRSEADAEDLVADAFEALVRRPPEPRGETQLRRWLRSVMLNLHRRQLQSVERGLADPLDYEPIPLETDWIRTG
jgi:DNA-directed RNA polymerase specialized sigma24 family protein